MFIEDFTEYFLLSLNRVLMKEFSSLGQRENWSSSTMSKMSATDQSLHEKKKKEFPIFQQLPFTSRTNEKEDIDTTVTSLYPLLW